MATDDFRCFLVEKQPKADFTTASVTRRPLAALPAGEVLIQVEWSALNYKDALSAKGHPGVTRTFPHVPGIDVAGVVLESSSPMLQRGEEVFVTGFDLGQNTWGGFSQRVRVPANWVMPLPEGLTLREVMIYGTAGLTAAMAIVALQRRGIEPGHGEVVVSGASGGVGSMAIAILSRAGYHAVASTGKAAAHDFLRSLGARRIIPRHELHDDSNKPLLPPRFAAAIDTVGSHTLSTLLRSVEPRGCVAACGLVGGAELPVTVYPFILRGVDLVGIDSPNCPLEERSTIWRKLADAWKPSMLDRLATSEIGLEELDLAIAQILAGETLGRVLVQPNV